MKRAFALIVVSCASSSAFAGGTAIQAYDDIAADAPLDVHGFLDTYALFNANAPASGTNQLRAYDTRAQRPGLGDLRITLAHRSHTIGFRLDAGIGSLADVYAREDAAAFAHPGYARAASYVEQAIVTVVVPIGHGLTVDAGKFSTPMGLEDNESLTNWNYGRSLLYTWAEPSFHSGVRVSYSPTPSLTLTGYWIDGWNSSLVDGNGMRTFAAAMTFSPTPRLQLVLVEMAGPEQAPFSTGERNPTLRNLFDTYVVYTPSAVWAFALTADYGSDAHRAGASWGGVAAYVQWHVRPWASAAARAEALADPQGFVTGTAQTVVEGTITAEFERAVGRARTIARIEYRHDQSTTNVFAAAEPMSRATQDTLTFAWLVTL